MRARTHTKRGKVCRPSTFVEANWPTSGVQQIRVPRTTMWWGMVDSGVAHSESVALMLASDKQRDRRVARRSRSKPRDTKANQGVRDARKCVNKRAIRMHLDD